METIRILIADENFVLRSELCTVLGREPDFEIDGEAESGAQAIGLALVRKPDIVLIDPVMNDGLGIVAIQQIAQQLPATGIIAFVDQVDGTQAHVLHHAGAHEVLDKRVQTPQVCETIHKVAQQIQTLQAHVRNDERVHTEWVVTKVIRCPLIGREAALLEQRRFTGEWDAQGERAYVIQGQVCSRDLECHQVGESVCRWNGGEGQDPFAQTEGLNAWMRRSPPER